MIRRVARRVARALPWRFKPVLRQFLQWLVYVPQLVLRRPAGHYGYHVDSPELERGTPAASPVVEVKLPGEGPDAIQPEDAAAWCTRQTLGMLTAVGYDRSGERLWTVDARGLAEASEAPAPWFAAPSVLPEVYPAFLESSLLVAAAEQIDAVALRERLPAAPDARSATDLLAPTLRPYCLFDRLAYRYNPETDEVEPRPGNQLVKVISGGGEAPRGAKTFDHRQRGPYLSSAGLPPHLSIGVRDVATLLPRAQATSGGKRRLLITAPFLARGGAEHTLFETARVLARDFDITIATLAPHRPELGDRRDDFHQITRRIYCLGDLVHPAAMPTILGRLLDQLGIETLYNANGSTLFYEFFPQLKAERPGLRVVDHLYDHRIGYIDRYGDPSLLAWIDACVAENRKIAAVLIDELGWASERVPVIWPCGRSADAFPQDTVATRREVRQELGLEDTDVVVLTAARMHEQKRPLDFVALADRVRDLAGIQFLLVGGGDLEDDVDAAIRQAPGAPIRRLPFRNDIPRLITAADVGCLLSEHEGLPVFMLECLQAGRPFLGTDVGEMAAVLLDTGAGLVTGKPGDLDAIEAAVRHLHDPARRADLAKNAANAGDRFDVETCAARYARVLFGDIP